MLLQLFLRGIRAKMNCFVEKYPHLETNNTPTKRGDVQKKGECKTGFHIRISLEREWYGNPALESAQLIYNMASSAELLVVCINM